MDAATKFPNFENVGNSCWLDSCLILIAHNKTLKKNVTNCQDSHIRKIVNDYNQALYILNDPTQRTALQKSRRILTSLQKTTLKYLKVFLKFRKGQFESAMCALLSLVTHDNSRIKQHFETSLIWHKQCSNCNAYSTSIIKKKTIVTLPKVVNFNPTAPTTCYTCVCKKEQEMKGEIKEASDCLIFHFENGAGKGDTLPSQFFISNRHYHMTCIIIFQDSKGLGKDHFITWIRQPFDEQWLEFNDMEDTFVYFSEVKPKLKMENIFIAVYEAFDNLGKIKIGTFSNDDISASSKFIETIHLVDDSVPSPGEENLLITTHESLYQQYFEPPSNTAVNSPCVPSCSNSSLYPGKEQFNIFKTSNDKLFQSVNFVSPNVTSSETGKDFGDDLHAEPKEENKSWLDPSKRKIIDDAIEKTFAAFFGQIHIRNAKRQAAADSASSSENEENIMVATYKYLDKNYFNSQRNESHSNSTTNNSSHLESANSTTNNSSHLESANSTTNNSSHLESANSTTNNSSHLESEQFHHTNFFSPDVTSSETDKDFGDDLHAEPKEENKSWLDPSKRKIIDDAIEKTFAAFFGQIHIRHAKRQAAVDSASSSENEENIMVATYKYLDKNYFNSQRNESHSNSTTNNSSHLESEKFDCTNHASSDSTETDSKDSYLYDDSHAERGKKRRYL